jgi:hypothetical protein
VFFCFSWNPQLCWNGFENKLKAAMEKATNRRCSFRAPVSIPIELRHELGFSLHSCSDLSSGGAFFDLSIPYPIGSRVIVSFSIPGDGEPIVCEGEVVNIPDNHDFGMGVHFCDLRDSDRQRIEAFTGELERLEMASPDINLPIRNG